MGDNAHDVVVDQVTRPVRVAKDAASSSREEWRRWAGLAAILAVNCAAQGE